ncbi:hypothetical protein M9Y10_002112 [Tritrichomonas musculus]|uniref:EF hand family protein n=1 Tax=Tritrichomonas musculus TaxID=1915356 RepID=A0ABR2L8V8_9EUKA
MSVPGDLLDRIRTHIYLNDIQPLEWFEDFDKLRSGRVSKERFRRCFEFLNFRITDEEYNWLCDTFEDKGEVNYRQFCHTIQDIFTNQELESSPTGTLLDSKKIVAQTMGKNLEDISPELDRLFAKMYHQVKTRGIHVREAYMDFDTHNNGRVTCSQFLRSNPFTDLSAHELTMLLQRYMDPILRDVNYRRLHLDLQAYADLPQNTTITVDLELPHHIQSFKLNPLPSNPSDVIQRFGTYVRKNRVRVNDFFQFRDSLNNGKITTDTFMNVLTLFGFQFSEEELHYLADKYCEINGSTAYDRYRDFCADVDKASKTIQPVTRSSTITNPRAVKAINTIKTYISKNRINILPPFQDFDKSKRGYVTELQFGRVLATMKIPIREEDKPLLFDIYENQSGVDYFKFVEDIDPEHSQQRRSYRPLGTTKQSIQNIYGHTPGGDDFVTTEVADQLIYESKRGLLPKMNEQRNIKSLLGELQKWAYVHSVQFQDFIRDFDPLNSGEVTNTQFRSGMLMAGYRLTDEEYQLLIDNYKSTKKENYINWRRFNDDVMQFVAPKTLEKEPLTTPLKPGELMTKTIETRTMRPRPTPQVLRILNIVNKFIVARRISLMEQFVDKDRFNHKQVTASSFAQVMQLIGVHISKGEIDQLCTFYTDPTTNFVSYPDFVRDVEGLGGVDFGENAATELVVNPPPDYSIDIQRFVASRPKLTAEELQWKAVLPKIQSFVLKRRIRIIEFFENFDYLRHGTVTQQKFRSVVGQLDLPIVEDEIQFIGKLFALESKPDLFNYRLFCQQVDAVFGITDLHKTPTVDGACRASYLPDPSETLSRIDQKEQAQINRIIDRMANFVATRRMEVRQQFEDYDKRPRRNYITKAQFKQCIGRLGLSSDENELELLCKRYKCTDLDEQNYHAFCNDIESLSHWDPPI